MNDLHDYYWPVEETTCPYFPDYNVLMSCYNVLLYTSHIVSQTKKQLNKLFTKPVLSAS